MKTQSTKPPVWQYPRPCIVALVYLMLALLTCGYESKIDNSTDSVSDTSSTKPCTETDEDCRNSTGAQEEVKCKNADGWNLKGSEWGCCGNYDGCCTYASFICYLHDAMCKCCDMGGQLCGPKCKPDPECAGKQEQLNKEGAGGDDLSDMDSDHLDIEDLEKTVPELQNDEASVKAEKATGRYGATQKDNHTENTNTGIIKTRGYSNDSAEWFAHSNDTSKETDENEDEGSGESNEKVHL